MGLLYLYLLFTKEYLPISALCFKEGKKSNLYVKSILSQFRERREEEVYSQYPTKNANLSIRALSFGREILVLSEYTKLEVGTSLRSREIEKDGSTVKTDSKFPVDAGFLCDKARGSYRVQGQ